MAVTLRRYQADAISLSAMFGAKRGLAQLWRAGLRTAPSSPLSNEDLLG